MEKKTLEEKIASNFTKRRKTLAVVESCTGGFTSSRITDIPGSSTFFTGGLVAYSNRLKTDILAVPASLIKKHGAVSSQVAKAMSRGARDVFSSDIAASITGIAGPSGGSKKKPVGLAYISVASRKRVTSRKVLFKGNRRDLKKKFSTALLNMIEKSI